MVKAIKAAPTEYVPPNKNRLSTTLLDDADKVVWAKVKARDLDGVKVDKFGSACVSDGWDSVDHLPLINAAFISHNDGGLYWRSVDTSGKTKSAEYCTSLMIEDIYKFGPENVVVVIRDTCSTMQKTWRIVMDEFVWISVIPCQAHVISLLMSAIGQLPEPATLVKEESLVVQWFSNHHIPLSIFRAECREKYGKVKELVKATAAR
eukprot:CAMPEP_0183371948 /NCGR_PEP_ID=MMETSP0164_2-20130417/106983_1 /TAXON_ID=221442 /ORGANISM="Coccolithus pelagicus ssp braarudi, Strain PLY182g" /LENGTH=205 /DNA_ID=CAMNT_0025548581 /DNA_START=350 /DNA_END=964 /DNA_ORIENTATION=+